MTVLIVMMVSIARTVSQDGLNNQNCHNGHKGHNSFDGFNDQNDYDRHDGHESIKRLWLDLMDSGSQNNATHPAYVKKLGFKQNDGLRSKTFGMVIAFFTLRQAGKGSILLRNLFGGRYQNRDGLVLGMLFLTLGCADIRFAESLSGGLIQLQTTKQVELFSAKEFMTAALGAKDEAFLF